MAIAFRTAKSSENIGGSPVEDSFTTVSGDTILIVGVIGQGGGGGTITTTFNGDAMTEIATVTQSGGILRLFCLTNPDIGTYNITFSLTGITNVSYCAAVYTGSSTQLNLQESSTNSSASAASLTVSNTSPTGWTILVAYAVLLGTQALAASTGSTSRTITNVSGNGIGFFDSNAVVSGAQSMSVTCTAASKVWGIIATIPDTVINQSDTNATADTITGTGNIWFLTQSDTNVSSESNTTKKPFINKEKDSPSTWTNKEKS